MGDRYMLFGADSFFFLWALSIAGGIAVVPSWAGAEPELKEGVLTRGGRFLVQARALLTGGCMVFWICTILGHALTDSNGGLFGSGRTILGCSRL